MSLFVAKEIPFMGYSVPILTFLHDWSNIQLWKCALYVLCTDLKCEIHSIL